MRSVDKERNRKVVYTCMFLRLLSVMTNIVRYSLAFENDSDRARKNYPVNTREPVYGLPFPPSVHGQLIPVT